MKILCHDVTEYKEIRLNSDLGGLYIKYKSYNLTEQIAEYRINYNTVSPPQLIVKPDTVLFLASI
ncbi:MAG: hypothetical protein DHS20C09_00970 [marine bacterium B5-7]|nr:MAG: hypothetical protein DHS20C09_00970 [marine bacterium B5-7]